MIMSLNTPLLCDICKYINPCFKVQTLGVPLFLILFLFKKKSHFNDKSLLQKMSIIPKTFGKFCLNFAYMCP